MRKFKIVVSFLLLISIPVLGAAKEMLQDFTGASKTLADYTGKGKWTVVMIWAHDCHICNQEVHNYVDFHNKHKNNDAEVLGISLDGIAFKSKAEEFITRHKINFPNLISEPEEVAAIYKKLTEADWYGTPTFLVYNPKGELRAQQVGAVPVELIEAFIKKETSQ